MIDDKKDVKKDVQKKENAGLKELESLRFFNVEPKKEEI
jgi:hypothetical protein